MTQPNDDPQRVFPIRDMVFGSFNLAKDHFSVFVKAAWLPVVLFVLGTAWVTAAFPIPEEFPDQSDLEATRDFVFGPGGLFEAVTAQLAAALMIVPAATAWIRLTVWGPPEDGRFPLISISGQELSYLFTYVALTVIFAFISLFVAALVGAVAGSLNPIVGIILGTLSGVLVISRLLPALGSTAFGERLGFMGAWRLTKQDTMPLFGAVISFGAPLLAAQLVLGLVIGPLLSDLGLFLTGAVMAAIQAVAILLTSVFIGRVYDYYRS